MIRITLAALVLVTFACASAPTPSPQPSSGPSSGPSSQPSSRPALERAAAARARLTTTEAGRAVLAATEAHGGLERWFSRAAVRFRYAYVPVGDRPARDTTQTVELASARAWHQGHDPEGALGWDGERCWTTFPEDFPARFWALTPYYFVGIHFVLGDPGVQLALSDEDPTSAGFPGATVVDVTFAAGTGDAPDDTYGLYLDAETQRVLAVRYTVSYPAFFAGREQKRSAEKLLVFSAHQTFDGLVLPTTHTFHQLDEGRARGAVVTHAAVSEVEVNAELDAAKLKMPADARVDDALDER